jgi:3-oxoadipate enol-lactonase
MSTLAVKGFDDLPLFAQVEGPRAGPAVVLSHSIGGDLGMWDALAVTLRERYRVLRFDRRGHGRSGLPAGDASLQTLGHDALAVMDAAGVARAHFVGLSQGGMEGLWLAANAPGRIARLVLANTTAHLGVPELIQAGIDASRAHGMAGVANGFLDRWLPAAFQAAQPQAAAQLRATFAGMPVEGFAACAAVLKHVDLRDALPRIAAPTLVIVGGAEAPPMQVAAQALAAGIAGARLAVIEGAGHLSAIDHPAQFAELVSSFLA